MLRYVVDQGSCERDGRVISEENQAAPWIRILFYFFINKHFAGFEKMSQ